MKKKIIILKSAFPDWGKTVQELVLSFILAFVRQTTIIKWGYFYAGGMSTTGIIFGNTASA
jgi:hypothetical protein